MKKKIGCLVTAMLLALGSGVTAHAEDYTGSGDMEVRFVGDKMESTFQPTDISDQASTLQPGDSVTFQIKFKNNGDKATDWYMTNEVVKSLEQEEDGEQTANGGAYTYVLTYTESGTGGGSRVLYSSESVGGDKSAGALGVGLHEATSSLEDYFYLDTLEAGKSGIVSLQIALDGETQGNAYQKTLAQLKMNFAVEKAAAPTTTTEKKEGTTRHVTRKNTVYMVKSAQTGDESNPLLWSGLTLTGGIMLMILGFARYRKGGHGHEDAE